ITLEKQGRKSEFDVAVLCGSHELAFECDSRILTAMAMTTQQMRGCMVGQRRQPMAVAGVRGRAEGPRLPQLQE
ncbi:hypothetical protein HPG69_000353, partial [Diceros bicornis minor]